MAYTPLKKAMTKQGHRAEKHVAEINKFNEANAVERNREEAAIKREQEKYADREERHREFEEEKKLR